MTYIPPIKRLRLRTAMLLGLLQVGAVHAQSDVSFVSGASVGNLTCPNASQQAKVVAPPSLAPRTGAIGNSPLSGMAALGPFRRLVIRKQPSISPRMLPGLVIGAFTAPHRVAFWGDSHIAAGTFMPTLMEVLHERGLTVAAGYLPPSMGRPNTHLLSLHAYCIGQAWDAEPAFTSSTRVATGPGLINRTADAGPESYLWLDVRNSDLQATARQLQIIYRSPTGGALEVSVNNGAPIQAQLDATNESQTLTLHGDAPIATVKMRVARGRVVLHGFMLDYIKPPELTVDVFGVPSATVRGWANADPDYLAHTLKGVHYDGVVLEYGTNEGNDPDFNSDKYAAGLAKALTNMRQVLPSASCLLVGPPDRGVMPKGNPRMTDPLKFSRIHRQIEVIQQQVGRQFNCANWDWQDLMGGPGGSYGWALADPVLMGRDVTHLSPEGYRRTAHALAHSLGWETQ